MVFRIPDLLQAAEELINLEFHVSVHNWLDTAERILDQLGSPFCLLKYFIDPEHWLL